MGIILDESYDCDWAEDHLYRELFIATSLSAYEAIRYHRPLHAAVMNYDKEFENSEYAIRMVLGVVSSFGAQSRYEKVILVEDVSQHPRSAGNVDRVLQILNEERIILPRERRVFHAELDCDATEASKVMEYVQRARCLICKEPVWGRPPRV